MIRDLRAFAWLRWRLFLNSFRGTRRRDGLERFSRATSGILPVLVAILLLPMVLAMAGAGVWAGWETGRSGEASRIVLAIARLMLGAISAVILILPVIASLKGLETGPTRFALLPVSRRRLHLLEMGAGLADPWILTTAPAILLFPMGCLAAGAPVAALVAFLAGVLLLIVWLGMGSLIGLALQWVYRERRRGEILTLLTLVALSLSVLAPHLFQRTFRTDDRKARAGGAVVSPQRGPAKESPARAVAAEESDGTQKAVRLRLTRWLPSELYVMAVAQGARRRAIAAAAPLGGLLLLAGVLYGLSSGLYGRLLETPAGTGRRLRGRGLRQRVLVLPGISPTASAVAFTYLKTYFRTVQGKMTILFSPIITIIVVFALSRSAGSLLHFAEKTPSAGAFLAMGCIAMSMLSLQNPLLNQFAMDGPGLTLQFLSPISDRDLVTGKAAAGGLILLAFSTIYTIGALAMLPGTPPALWPVPVMAGVSAYLLVAPLSALLAALFPRAVDLNQLRTGSRPSNIAGLIGFGGVALAFTPPMLLGAAIFLLGPLGTMLLMAAWTAAAAAGSRPLLDLAARTVASRRENLAMTAQGR